MYCKWCGMDSSNEQKCDWCGKLIAPPKEEPVLETVKPVEDNPEVVEDIPETDLVPELQARIDGTPLEDVPTEPDESERSDLSFKLPPAFFAALENWGIKSLPYGARFERYLTVMLVFLIPSLLIAHYSPDGWVSQLVGLSFISGLALGVFGIIEYYDEENMPEVVFAIVGTVLIGPVYASILYFFAGIMRKGFNPAIMALLGSFIAVRFLIGFAAHGFMDTVMYMVMINISQKLVPHFLQALPVAAAFGGWMAANITCMSGEDEEPEQE